MPALSAAETRAAEALLAGIWGRGTSVRAAEPIWDRSHVIRLHLAAGRSVVMKRRADTDTFGVELAALEYLDEMPEPVAPRLLGADAGAGWPQAVTADYPALARPGSAQVQVPDFWQPEV
jgi:hypothetical protein